MTIFNEALLSTQAWRLISCPESLFGRVMRSKYYPNGDFLNASLRMSHSYSWKSFWGSKSLVKEGPIWRVGNGAKIDIVADTWVGVDAMARNANVDVLFAGTRRMRGHWTPVIAECKAILFGVQIDNYVAHYLASFVPFDVEQIWEKYCPAFVFKYVLMDKLSLDQ
ncbi:hypothetical protein POM88_041203 [Heracleum sosnowskyi]|uniref:Uncharacterized protein n=1 Tax=Heracleum sosnowskyi TaxID=360622 RepID=A0AAD8MAI3_9APIA|nr:hypothetical protein POM88_041203 [Heracleum sosnowskyi]